MNLRCSFTLIFDYKIHLPLPPSPPPPSLPPEVRGEVNQIVYVGDRHLAAVERNRVLLPPSFNRYFIWGFPDCSARIALVEGDRVRVCVEGDRVRVGRGRVCVGRVRVLEGGENVVERCLKQFTS